MLGSIERGHRVELLKAPFPWFGGKSRVASEVWGAFGDVHCYIEPFFGSGAVLLNRPLVGGKVVGSEIINDLDGFVSNFWRAVKLDPVGVANYCQDPVNEIDLLARHRWLCDVVRKREFLNRMQRDPDYYDVKVAGWWVWGLSTWIGSDWCTRVYDPTNDEAKGRNKDVKKQIPCLTADRGVLRSSISGGGAQAYLQMLSDRLRYVKVCCGDWTRIMNGSCWTDRDKVGIFLDPPYSEGYNEEQLYASKSTAGKSETIVDDVALKVRDWAFTNGHQKNLRIVLCGYEGQYGKVPSGWREVAWKAIGGYGNQSKRDGGNENRHRERLWLSPGCLEVQESILDMLSNSTRGES